MTYYFKRIAILFAAIFCICSASLFAQDEVLVITATPNKTECNSTLVTINEEPLKVELCVTQGNFSPDKYVLKFNGQVVLQGIDDETTIGITSTYKGKTVALKCVPQIIKTRATAEEIQKAVPSYSKDKVNEIADLMSRSSFDIEIARQCVVTVGDKAVMKAQVIF